MVAASNVVDLAPSMDKPATRSPRSRHTWAGTSSNASMPIAELKAMCSTYGPRSTTCRSTKLRCIWRRLSTSHGTEKRNPLKEPVNSAFADVRHHRCQSRGPRRDTARERYRCASTENIRGPTPNLPSSPSTAKKTLDIHRYIFSFPIGGKGMGSGASPLSSLLIFSIADEM